MQAFNQRPPHTKICLTSAHTSLAAMRQDVYLRNAAAEHLIELRLDMCGDVSRDSVAETVACFGHRRCVVTCGDRPEAIEHYATACRLNVAYVDVDLKRLQRAPQDFAPAKSATCRILSTHCPPGATSLSTLNDIVATSAVCGCGVVKVVVQPARVDDIEPLLHLRAQRSAAPALLALATTRAGFFSRLLVAQTAQPPPFTFACSHPAWRTAAGQVPAIVLQKTFGLARIRRQTQVFGLLGAPLQASLSPWLHNAALRRADFDAVYVPFEVDGDPQNFCGRMAPLLRVRGLSVTMPHKQRVMSLCASLCPASDALGAVNTLVWRAGAWHGSNTDAGAALACMQALLPAGLRGRRVGIVGAGGVARAVAWAARQAGARVTIAARSPQRAQAVASRLGCEAMSQMSLLATRLDLLANCTPQVMPLPFEIAALRHDCAIFDTLYAPDPTPLVAQAQAEGRRALGGMRMFVAQARAQARIFYGSSVEHEMAAIDVSPGGTLSWADGMA